MERKNREQSTGMADEIREQRDKFKNMTFPGKIAYIFDYYKLPIIIVVAILLIVGSITKNALTRKNDILYAAMVNSNAVSNEAENLALDYYKTYGVDVAKDQIVLDTSMSIQEGFPDQISVASASKMLALFNTNTMDCIVCDAFVVDYYAKEGAYADLAEFFPSDVYQKLVDKGVIYEAKDENGKSVPTGINMTNCLKLIQNKLYEVNQPIYMVFPRHCPHEKEARNMFQFLFGE